MNIFGLEKHLPDDCDFFGIDENLTNGILRKFREGRQVLLLFAFCEN
jgi:hypothetical protein